MTDPQNEGHEPEELPTRDAAALDRLHRFGGDKLLHEMIRLFMENAPQRIAAAGAAVDGGDAPAAELSLHSLKSSSAQLGALRMQRLSEQGEKLAHAGDLMIVGLLVQDLEEEWDRVRSWLADVRGGGATT